MDIHIEAKFARFTQSNTGSLPESLDVKIDCQANEVERVNEQLDKLELHFKANLITHKVANMIEQATAKPEAKKEAPAEGSGTSGTA